MKIITMHLVFSNIYGSRENDLKDLIHFTIWPYSLHPGALTPDQGTMIFTVLVEGFMGTITMHLFHFKFKDNK